jgi:hypothetical protein
MYQEQSGNPISDKFVLQNDPRIKRKKSAAKCPTQIFETRVARRLVFIPKSLIWVNFGGLAMEDFGLFNVLWSILQPFGTICDHWLYFMVIWYIFPVLVFCTNNNLATLFETLKPTFL